MSNFPSKHDIRSVIVDKLRERTGRTVTLEAIADECTEAITALFPKNHALVPLVMTRQMLDVTDSDGWSWPDLLAAAEAVDEHTYEHLCVQSSLPINTAGLPYEFIPVQPPRVSVPLEGIYLNLWLELVTQRPEEWEAVLRVQDSIDQRAATVAASFIVFMGCNAGRDFSRMAEQYCEQTTFVSRESAYVAAWAVLNQRDVWKNHNMRMVEAVLSTYTNGERTHPIVTIHDIDVIDSMVRWWSTPSASLLRAAAEKQYEAVKAKRRWFEA